MHADQEDRHPWLRDEKALLRESARRGACRCSASASARSCSPRRRARPPRRASRPEIGWHDVERHPGGRARPGARAARAALRRRSSGTATSSRCRPARRRSRAAPSASRRSASATSPGASSSTPRSRGADAEAWIDDYRSDEDAVRIGLDPDALRRRTREAIGAWNDARPRALRAVPRPRSLLGRDVGAREAAVDEEGRGGHVRRLVARQEERAPARSRAASAKRPIGRCTSRRAAFSGSLANSSCSSGVLTGPGQSAFTRTPRRANSTPSSRDSASTRALGGRVGDLRHGGAHHGDERGRVDDRAAAAPRAGAGSRACSTGTRCAGSRPARAARPRADVSSTEESSVGLMPALLKSTSMRPSSSLRARVHLAHLVLVGDVGLERQLAVRVRARGPRRRPSRPPRANSRARLGADAARGAGDHAHLALEPSRPSVILLGRVEDVLHVGVVLERVRARARARRRTA